ncbi:family 20 glycosylhydrolase [Panacibacter sp. DH6]|uniref:Family 20 glycosylhydrolase n=1 Tax=Panacibacter microcysteis TaxID=2793269 RepID=A0A931GYG0_9BACT|nr:family 20 glycosylhydrolase [Panacibacter microcysteis]MBG9375807.1 family 20 glycosylhydrolase [Panacibacter microcysteis]
MKISTCLFVCFLLLLHIVANAQGAIAKPVLDSILPVRGFCIAAPAPDQVPRFIKFLNEELAPRKVNTLILRVDYNYAYTSHPELSSRHPLTKSDVQQLVNTCRKNNIRLIPQVNLLGHQSWAGTNGKLLEVYPAFDETPYVKLPEKYVWPNADSLYCKSYCPLHPGVHKVVFELVDEICNVFETDAFHAGMDEVFYLGEDRCPRCSGKDKAELFAGEVSTIRNHLALQNRELWIWGDRLIDGKTTGLGMWEASYNDTYRAIDMIPKDVVVCDWHYERADKTPVYFAMKGIDVITCPWREPALAVVQMNDMIHFRKESTKEMQEHFKGMMQTVWSDADDFMDGFYGLKKDNKEGTGTAWDCFKALYSRINGEEK